MIASEPIAAPPLQLTQAARFYRPELDVVRFFAFAAVFLHHELPRDVAWQHSGAFLGHLSPKAQVVMVGTANAFGFGLPLFFVLSAYLIGTLLLREKDLSGTIDLRSFYIRRILRIWPLYFVGLAIGCAWALLIANRPHDVLLLTAFALMVGNWFAMGWQMLNPMMPLWSISIEEQFYLFCPITVSFLSRRGLAVFSVCLIALSNLTLFALGRWQSGNDSVLWLNSLVQFQMFGAGLLLCLWAERRTLAIAGWARCLSFATGLGCWLIACLVFGVRQPSPTASGAKLVAGYSVGMIGCLLMIAALLQVDSRWLPRPMIYLGKISFGLYVYHQLAIDSVKGLFPHVRGLAHFVLCLVSAAGLTVAMAAVSYRVLELPFLRWKRRFELIPSRAV